MRKFFIKIFSVFVICLLFCSCSNLDKKYSKNFFGVFDTEISFTAYTKNENEFNKYYDILVKEFQKYHGLYSSFEDYTENNIKTINDNAGIKAVKVNFEIIELLEFSIKNYYDLSQNTDISIGKITELWRVERDKSVDLNGKLPNEENLKNFLKFADISKIKIDRENSTVFLEDKNIKIDVGAIAKGYTVEKVMNFLRKNGLENAIISAGGNVKAIGIPKEKNKTKWGVGIQTPNYENNNLELTDIIFTDEKAVVTSGDYQRYYYVDKKIYNHIIDPRTAYPSNKIKSVTVVTDDSGIADFLSTALFLEDVENGKKILERVKGAEAFWILNDGSVKYTLGMEKMLKSKGAMNK